MKRLKQIWYGMQQRCYNPNSQSAKYYHDLGITICDEWKEDFNAFAEWALSHGYSDTLTIDRINSDGNYEPNNCQWITKSENSRKAGGMQKQRDARAKKPAGNWSVWQYDTRISGGDEGVVRCFGKRIYSGLTHKEAHERWVKLLREETNYTKYSFFNDLKHYNKTHYKGRYKRYKPFKVEYWEGERGKVEIVKASTKEDARRLFQETHSTNKIDGIYEIY